MIAKSTNFVTYANPNAASKPFIDKAILDDPTIYPPPEVMAKLYHRHPLRPEGAAGGHPHLAEGQDRASSHRVRTVDGTRSVTMAGVAGSGDDGARRRPPEVRLPAEPWRDPKRRALHQDPRRRQEVRQLRRRRRRLARHLPAASSSRCWGRPAAARRRCCACWPASRRRRPGTIEIDGVDMSRGAALSAAGQHDVPVLRAVPAHDGRAEHRLRPEAGEPAARRDRPAGRGDAGPGAADRSSPGASRTSSPAARSSGWRWRAPSSRSRRCCCSTSRWARSTASCARRRSSSWSTSRRRWA